ncbi:L,D-transpeptidase [Thalassospira sp.]|uniref:L,D-transpeptidase family protein n=1 Tax=Thalassospira sp. TaxID=1912094 RepID=UPI002735B191|nr:L,D-transpeptidase family protein [Thalassospira sp.]MDP2699213.1 L,D-transpeptidase family protein [Thalassospira sp.]
MSHIPHPSDLVVTSDGILVCKGRSFRCALGKTGITDTKREGDGATPVGRWKLRYVLYRADRRAAPVTALPVQAITPDDGWCDDPAHASYNRPVRLPCAASHEKLWREDGLYDLVVTLTHNDAPAIPGNGSAIFMHIARPGYSGTEGCIALAADDLETVLGDCRRDTHIVILPQTSPA